MIIPVPQLGIPFVRRTEVSEILTDTYVHPMVPRGMNQVVSGGEGSVGGDGDGNVASQHSGSGSESSSQSPGGQHGPSIAATKIVIPVCVALALIFFAAFVVYMIMRFRRGSRSRRASAAVPPTAAEKPQLFEVQLESPPAVHPVDAKWNDIKPLSVKYISQNVYELEQVVAASLSSYPGTPAASRPVSMQTSSSHSSSSTRSGGSRREPKNGEDGRLRVAVTIAMPSPRQSVGEEKGRYKMESEECPPLCLGVADVPWQATKL
ncbi:hypothetical protein DAEQUDRAFT_726047 [Daedalea quercina L-15889]|uniref:Uncharacterized protein n=1 Tax=Daedalea quercina L-15889 TaxID=1314783 RepID=A0A165QXC9_9APHY|nr:hypothetical protein DAEQUDRAFT_726047 [Daedalea quercina L-15889]